MKKTVLAVIGGIARFVFNISVLVVGVYLVYHFAIQGFNRAKDISSAAFEDEKSVKEVVVTIPQGASTPDVAEILFEAELISSVDWFRIQSRLDNMDGKYKAGKYTLNTKMSDTEIMDYLARGTSDIEDMIRITIPEGFTASQIGQYLEERGLCTAEEFRAAMNNSEFDYGFLSEIPERSTAFEGYLFPDTYFVDEGVTPDEIISKMLSRFEEVYTAQLEASPESAQTLSMDETIIRASIIEAEIRVPEERAVCASVIQNRLDAGMPLQMDATVLYALGSRKSRLLIADLEVDSPYNTYKYAGLPIGPICNPGSASIKAAMNPANTDYMYYVVNDLETGSHEFTVDYESFLLAKERYKNLE